MCPDFQFLPEGHILMNLGKPSETKEKPGEMRYLGFLRADSAGVEAEARQELQNTDSDLVVVAAEAVEGVRQLQHLIGRAAVHCLHRRRSHRSQDAVHQREAVAVVLLPEKKSSPFPDEMLFKLVNFYRNETAKI